MLVAINCNFQNLCEFQENQQLVPIETRLISQEMEFSEIEHLMVTYQLLLDLDIQDTDIDRVVKITGLVKSFLYGTGIVLTDVPNTPLKAHEYLRKEFYFIKT